MRILINITGHGYIPDASTGALQAAVDALTTAAEATGLNLRADLQLTEPGVEPAPIPPPADPLTITAIAPTAAVCGGPDLTLQVTGTGFTASSVILFNGGEEATTYMSSTKLATVVKPSLVSSAVTVPVSVVGAPTSVDFTFSLGAGALGAKTPPKG